MFSGTPSSANVVDMFSFNPRVQVVIGRYTTLSKNRVVHGEEEV